MSSPIRGILAGMPWPSGLPFALVVLAWASAPVDAVATPRYTAVYGQDCTLCHVNPTGGGLRSPYASRFIVPEELATRGWTEAEEASVSPELAPNVLVGLDLRSLIYQVEGGDGSTLSMQGDVYLSARLGGGFLAYAEQGQNGGGEVFGAIQGLPLDGYLKAGRFLPDYGWRFADHQMFNRRYLRDDDGTDIAASFHASGVEVGVSPGSFSLSASVQGETERHGDAYAARVFWHRPLGPVNAGVGGSLLRRDGFDGSWRAVGGIWYLNWGPATWLGQIDETRRGGRLGNLVSQEWTLTLGRGLDLRGIYGFQDPDRARPNGLRRKYGAGVVWMPRPYFNLVAMGHRWKIDPGELVEAGSRVQAELVLHFFY